MIDMIIIVLLAVSITGAAILLYKRHLLKSELRYIEQELRFINSGNIRHRLLATSSCTTREIRFLINSLCASYQSDLDIFEESEQKYKDLMINLSHDIKTPLASMLGHLELLSESASKELSPHIIESLEVINRKSIELSDFLDMLFQWTKLDANEERFLPVICDITEVSRNILSNWIEPLEKNSIAFSFLIPDQKIRLLIDLSAYKRIINNLLKNIINHSHAKSMSFSLSASDNKIWISVTDNGIGIPEAEQAFVFERLYQCDLSRQTKGNGLGLAIVRELVTKSGGTIELRSVPNVCTEFLITYPFIPIQDTLSSGKSQNHIYQHSAHC